MSVLNVVRFGVPGGMLVLGVVLILVGGSDASAAGIVLVGSAVLVALAGALVRFSMRETGDRDREQLARDHYLEHGRWPGEPESPVEPEPTPREPPREAHPGVRAVPMSPGRARAARRKRPPRR